MAVRIVDITGIDQFQQIPPCADAGFDHRTCDYWEDANRGSKASRSAWLEIEAPPAPARPAATFNPFAADADDEPIANPFAPAGRPEAAFNPFATDDDAPAENPFAPSRPARPSVGSDVPRKLGLLGRGLGVFGSYAKVLLDGDEPDGVRTVRPVVGVSAGPATARALPAAAGRTAARGDHLHRDDGRGPPSRPRRDPGRSGLRRPCGTRLRGRRGVSGARHEA